MATIKLKNSQVKGKVPVASDLDVGGELAVNHHADDPGLFLKDTAGNVRKIAGAGNISTPNASTTVHGLAQLADATAITAGTAGRVVDAAQLKAVSDADDWTRTGTTVAPRHAGDVVTVSAGTAAAPGLAVVGDPNTGLFAPAADTLAVAANGAKTAEWAHNPADGTGLYSVFNTDGTSIRLGKDTSSAYVDSLAAKPGNYAMIAIRGTQIDFNIGTTGAPSSAVRVNPAGQLIVGNGGNAHQSNTGPGTSIQSDAFVATGTYIFAKNNVTNGYIGHQAGTDNLVCVSMGNDGTGSLSTGVLLGKSATSWSSTSDERLKTDLEPIADGLDKVATLRAMTGRYKTDEVGTSRSFLIAQDVQAVLPEAVSGTTDDDDQLSLRYTEVIPLLVAALKDAKDKIENLDAAVAALTPTS